MATSATNIEAALSQAGSNSHWSWDNLKVFLGEDQVAELYYSGKFLAAVLHSCQSMCVAYLNVLTGVHACGGNMHGNVLASQILNR